MSEKEKRLKTALVRTRKIIAQKFQKLHNQNIKRDVKLNEKYAPITKSLKKIINIKKDNNNSKRNQASGTSETGTMNMNFDNNNDESSSIEDPDENNDVEFDNELVFDDFQPTLTSGDDTFQPTLTSEHNEQGSSSSNTIPIQDDSVRRLLERNELTDSTRLMDSFDYDDSDNDVLMGAVASKRRRSESDEDLVDDSKQQNISKNVKRVRKSKLGTPKIAKKWSELQYLRAVRRTAMAKIKKKLPPIENATQKRLKSILCPEDFDDAGNYRGAEKPKRRKVLTSSLRYMHVKPKIKPKAKLSSGQSAKKRTTAVGEGIEKEFIPYNENIVYEYWDDPNELCERLQLLLASQSAGNTNHGQEINSIILELREQNIIL